jgi:hypothetical protein
VSVTTVTATGTAAVDSLEVAFDVMTPIDLSLVFTGWDRCPPSHTSRSSPARGTTSARTASHSSPTAGPRWKG